MTLVLRLMKRAMNFHCSSPLLWHRRVECLRWKIQVTAIAVLVCESPSSEGMNEHWAENSEAGGTLVFLLCLFTSNIYEQKTSPIPPKACPHAPCPFSFKPSSQQLLLAIL